MVGRVGYPRLALQFCWRVVLPTHRGAVAQELLDLALVAVRRSAVSRLIAATRRCSANACTVSRVVWRSGAPAALSLRLSTPRPKRSWASISGGTLTPSGRSARIARPVPKGGMIGRERLAEQARDLREHEHPVAGGVVDARQVVAHGVLEHADDVVLVDELVARVEAEDRRHHRAARTARRARS